MLIERKNKKMLFRKIFQKLFFYRFFYFYDIRPIKFRLKLLQLILLGLQYEVGEAGLPSFLHNFIKEFRFKNIWEKRERLKQV